jgi:hypothetical protein
MTSASNAPRLQRLADQLLQLSEVTECLTFRLLELEERLAARERHLDASGDEGLEAAAGREIRSSMQGTEDRLARIEAALAGLGAHGSLRPVQPVPPPVLQQEPLISRVSRPAASPGGDQAGRNSEVSQGRPDSLLTDDRAA